MRTTYLKVFVGLFVVSTGKRVREREDSKSSIFRVHLTCVSRALSFARLRSQSEFKYFPLFWFPILALAFSSNLILVPRAQDLFGRPWDTYTWQHEKKATKLRGREWSDLVCSQCMPVCSNSTRKLLLSFDGNSHALSSNIINFNVWIQINWSVNEQSAKH